MYTAINEPTLECNSIQIFGSPFDNVYYLQLFYYMLSFVMHSSIWIDSFYELDTLSKWKGLALYKCVLRNGIGGELLSEFQTHCLFENNSVRLFSLTLPKWHPFENRHDHIHFTVTKRCLNRMYAIRIVRNDYISVAT